MCMSSGKPNVVRGAFLAYLAQIIALYVLLQRRQMTVASTVLILAMGHLVKRWRFSFEHVG